MARIFIMGSGVVGSATGRGFAHNGHDVTFIDISAERRDLLSAEGHDAQARLDLRRERAGYVFLTLPTPNQGLHFDLSAFRRGVLDVGAALREASAVHTVVVRSTVPPGTTEKVVKPLLEQTSGTLTGRGFCLASNPEFLRAACAEEDFLWPWMTVIGSRSKRAAERLQSLFEPFGGQLRTFDNPETAELIKCAHNLFNATKISFWNEIWLICNELGLKHDDVASTVADSAEGSFNRRYGIRGGAPYGGVCLPKDTQGFLGFAREIGVDMPLLNAVVDVNDILAAKVADELDQFAETPGARATHSGQLDAGPTLAAAEVDTGSGAPDQQRAAGRLR